VLTHLGALWAKVEQQQGGADNTSDIRYRDVARMLEQEAAQELADADASASADADGAPVLAAGSRHGVGGGGGGVGEGGGACSRLLAPRADIAPGQHAHLFPFHKCRP
jgi:hypothetical protein